MTFNVVMTAAGPQPTPPATLNAELIALVAATQPGYTVLPSGLVEDISSTDTGALIVCDSAAVELVNSITPYGANQFLLNLLGGIYGVPQGVGANTSVSVVFSGITSQAGFVIAPGFTVSDGTYQYVIPDGGVVDASGSTAPLFALATLSGSWPVLANSVTQIVTALPAGITLTVTNPFAGTPSSAPQTPEQYRFQVMRAGKAAAQGMPNFLKTKLLNVTGVQYRLVSILQQAGGGWEVIVGGGDPNAVAYAIFSGLFDVSTLVGSELQAVAITNASLGVVETNLNHGFTSGQIVSITSASPGAFDVTNATATVIDEKHFSYGVNTTGFGAYTGGGVITPNLRNETVSLDYYPNTYDVTFVVPPQQTVGVTLLWNTTLPNFISQSAVASLGSAAIVNYINGITVSQPINLFDLQNVFQQAVASVIAPSFVTRMAFTVTINGITVAPESGTGIIAGDPESYFYTTSSNVSISQG